MKLKCFASLLLLMISVQAFSQEPVLTVKTKSGETLSFNLKDIGYLDFDLPANVSVNDLAQVVKTLKVLQNYPNPFNPSTTIRYEVPSNEPVTISIFDLTGRLIHTMTMQPTAPGFQNIVWNGTNSSGTQVASGMYIYQVKQGSLLASKKMIFIK